MRVLCVMVSNLSIFLRLFLVFSYIKPQPYFMGAGAAVIYADRAAVRIIAVRYIELVRYFYDADK